MSPRLGWLRRHGPAVFGVLLLFGALFVIQREFRGLKVADIRVAIEALPASGLMLAAAWTVLAYLILAIYDRLGSIYAGHPVSWTRSLVASFCAYSLAHNLGFAAVSGAAVRFRLYSAWGLSPLEIAKVVGFTSLTYGLGAMSLGGLVLIMEPEVVPWLGTHLPRWAMQALALPLWGIVITYVSLSRFVHRIRLFGHDIELPRIDLALRQVALATVDVAVTAAIFYALLPAAPELTYLRFVGIYLTAYSAGMAAHVPGGLGVFDGAILLGLQPYLGAPEVIGALLIFRLYYYIIPLFGSGALFAVFELSQRRHVLRRMAAVTEGSRPLEVPALASLVAMAAALLIFLGALPIRGTIMEAWAGREVAIASHFATSLVGSLLLVMAYGLLRRLAIAWAGAMVLLLLGAFIAWLRGEPWWLWCLYLVVAGLLAATRAAFYRSARLRREPLSPEALVPMLAVAACGITLALVAYRRQVADASWWGVVISPTSPLQVRFAVGLTAVLLLAGVFQLLRPARFAAAAWDAASRARLAAWGPAPALADGVVFGEQERAGFAFLKLDRMWLALGDPQGERADAITAIWRFRDLCDRASVDAAVWNASGEFLPIYSDVGLSPVLQTEDGVAPRYLVCRAETDLTRLAAQLPEPMHAIALAAAARPAATVA